jgi:hypothetical protein
MEDIKHGFDFGNDNETSFISISIRSFALLIPGMILGHLVDKYINKLKKDDKQVWKYVLLQSLVNILIITILHKLHHNYTSEFQRTLPGLYFSGLFFGLQVNYIKNIRELLGGD